MTETLLLQIRDGIATLTLNRPKSLNALNLEMARALSDACQEVEASADCRCVIIRGAGGNFLAGGDVQSMREGLESGDSRIVDGIITHVHLAVEIMQRMAKPVIAAVEGSVAGGGVSLMLACDLALAADNAKFTLAYSLIGANPDGGATWHLPRLAGLKKAMELCLLSEQFDADTALKLGLLNRVVPAKNLERETGALAETLVNGPLDAYGRIKQLLNDSATNSLSQQLSAEQNAFVEGLRSPDFIEGVNAFCEKRKPSFRRTPE